MISLLLAGVYFAAVYFAAGLVVGWFFRSGEVLIDLTADTVDAAHLLSGYTAHDKSGAPITGSCDYDSDTSDDTAAVSEILCLSEDGR